jgi:acetoin utilization deacetylase AcuC-like enzyme
VQIFSHADMARLHPTGMHPESQTRLERLLGAFPDFEAARAAVREDVERCHEPAYVELVRSIERETWLDPDTVCSESTYEAALLAAGAAITAAEHGGFAFVRPPGHHALPARAMGFCLFDNIAVAARFARAELGLGRVAIVDWDVHHGNGTEAIFWSDSSVLFVSMHQWPFYPGTGGPDEQGETTLNLPLPAGSGDDVYLTVFADHVEPAVRAFEPDLVLVSAGFDAHADDPLAQMLVTAEGFTELARRSAALAPRAAAVLEGGYNLETLPQLVAAALSGFEEATD